MTRPTSDPGPDRLPSGSAYVLTLDCPERPGLVHAVTGFLLERHADILELKQFDDFRAGRFFLRVHFVLDAAHGDPGAAGLGEEFASVAGDFGVSNHPDHQGLVEWHGIPFFHVPVTRETKPQAEERLLELVEQFDVELVVLARYMQILSDGLARELTGRAINIHHSFLPSFKGAKPYHQAYERGVKTVGATAHYVSSDLDEGPIISQQVQEVDHAYGPEELVAAGRDTECKALSNAVRWHCEGRVFLHGNRTVILR